MPEAHGYRGTGLGRYGIKEAVMGKGCQDVGPAEKRVLSDWPVIRSRVWRLTGCHRVSSWRWLRMMRKSRVRPVRIVLKPQFNETGGVSMKTLDCGRLYP